MPAATGSAEYAALYQVVAAYALALLVPALFLGSAGSPVARMGFGWPEHEGSRVTLLGVVLTLPVGFWLAAVTPDPWGSPLTEFLQFLTLVPEHFLIFGVFATLLLPGRRLGWPGPSARQRARAAFAIVATGLLFGVAHLGKPHAAEIVTSFPLGFLFAWMTVYSGSIWPAVVAHCTLNLFPMAVLSFSA